MTRNLDIDVAAGPVRHRNASRIFGLSPTYISWASMKKRCDNPKDEMYPKYGGSGIGYSPEWSDFAVFLKDMGPRPQGTSLDRRDGAKGYSKENCRWATPKEQARNRKTNKMVEFNGKSQSIAAWSDELGIPFRRLYKRLVTRNWPVEKAFEYPAKQDPL